MRILVTRGLGLIGLAFLRTRVAAARFEIVNEGKVTCTGKI